MYLFLYIFDIHNCLVNIFCIYIKYGDILWQRIFSINLSAAYEYMFVTLDQIITHPTPLEHNNCTQKRLNLSLFVLQMLHSIHQFS